MPTVTIDNREYDLDTLSDDAKMQLTNIQVCDQEIARLNIRLAIAQTARATYGRALQEALPRNSSYSLM